MLKKRFQSPFLGLQTSDRHHHLCPKAGLAVLAIIIIVGYDIYVDATQVLENTNTFRALLSTSFERIV